MAPITTGFGFDSTAAEVIAGVDLSGRRAIVTGGSSGIGVETARALAGAGAEVTLAVRDTAAGERTAAAIAGGAVRVGRLDLVDQASVAAFVADWSGPLDLLVNNAGVMALPALEHTPEGWEVQFATNHLGHFALAVGLHDALAAADGARIVSLSSRGHLRSPVVFEDLQFDERPYDPWLAYGQSKTANALFAVQATRRWAGDGIYANAVHPGAIAGTNLSRYMDPAVLADCPPLVHPEDIASVGQPIPPAPGTVAPGTLAPAIPAAAAPAAASPAAVAQPGAAPVLTPERGQPH